MFKYSKNRVKSSRNLRSMAEIAKIFINAINRLSIVKLISISILIVFTEVFWRLPLLIEWTKLLSNM